MTASNVFRMIMNIGGLISALEETGISIEIGDDFSEFRRLRNGQKERSAMYSMFDVGSSFVDASNAFWVCGFNAENELMHTQAVRLLDLQALNLAAHLRIHRHKYITPGSTPDADKTYFAELPVLEKIKGRVAYHGEFWVKPGAIGRRNIGLTAALSRIAFEMTTNLWHPDFLFGLIPTPMATRGVSVRYGYYHCEPGAWYGPDQDITSEEMLVWMSHDDLETCIASKPKHLDDNSFLKAGRKSTRKVGMVA